MRKIDKYIEYYNHVSYAFLIDYLLFSDNLSSDLKKTHSTIVNQNFLVKFKNILEKISNGIYYPKEIHTNATSILDYIEENSTDLTKELDDCFDVLENVVIFSDTKYLTEFQMKKNSLEEYKNTDYFIWKKEDIRESIRFDYIAYMSLNSSKESYVQNYLPSFILSKNYVYSLKKIIYICPEILEIKQFKNRAIELLNLDLKLLDDYDIDIIKEYISKNYHQTVKDISFYTEELEAFKREITLTLHQINHLNLNPFDIEEFKNYYELLKLEYYLYFDNEIDTNSISLDTIYKFIEENNENSMLNNKTKLLNLLNSKKKIADDIEEYNHYLIMLNEIEEVNKLNLVSEHFVQRANKYDFIIGIMKCWLKKDYSLYQKLYESKEYDLGNFESYIVSDSKFNSIKEYLKETYYPISVRLFLKECPSMFMDPIIYNRTIEILKSYDDKDSKQMIKRLEKMMKR